MRRSDPRAAAGAGRRALGFVAAAVLASCVTGPALLPPGGPRAVLVSFDGLGGVRLGQLLEAGRLRAGGFDEFLERGVVAGRAVTVTPSLTSVAHVSAITGALPSRTGIVSNVFHRAGDPFGTTVTGFTTEIGAETLWEAAIRQGKRVGVLVYPGADATSPRGRGSFGMVWPESPLRPSTVVTVSADAWGPSVPVTGSYTPSRETRLRVDAPGGPLSLRLQALDSTDDGAVEFDVVRVLGGGPEGPPVASVRAGEWFRLDAPGDASSGETAAWCRVATLDPRLDRLVLYVGAFYGMKAYPEDYRRRLSAAVGPWPGQADPVFLRGDSSVRSEAAYEEQSARLSDYLTRVLLTTIRVERWDLLIHYQPAVDEMEHAFEPALQPAAAAGSLPSPAPEQIVRAFQGVDRELAQVRQALRPSDFLFVQSDHGMAPVERAVDLDRFLAARGWRIARGGEAPGGDGPRVVQVCASSGIAHLYLRHGLDGRAPAEALAALRADLAGLATEYAVPVDAILERGELGRIGLDHPSSGDLVVLLRPGFVFEHGPGGSTVLFPPRARGAHGFRNAFPALDAAFLALGPGIGPSRPATVSLLDVAPRVARALGIDPPREVGGRPPRPGASSAPAAR